VKPIAAKKLAVVGLAVILLTPVSASAQQPGPAKPRPRAPATTPAPAPASVPPPAPAPPTLSETLTGEAKADYEAAKLLHGDGDFAGALVKFKGAYEKSTDPRLLWNIAACEKNLRHYASVLAYIRQYLHDGDAILSADDKAEAEALLPAIEPFTSALELSVSEPDAKVYVDDTLVGVTPLDKPIVVDIGVRKIRVAKDGFEELTKDVPIGGSPKIHLDVKLEKIVHEATLAVTAHPGDEILVDGSRVGIGTWRGVLPSGGHMLRVTAPEMRPYQNELVLKDKETRTVAITLDREIKPSAGVPSWVWIGGGALLLTGAAVGGYFLLRPQDEDPTLPVGTLEPGNVQASFPGIRFR
jgi:hypothetical protein